MPDDKIENFNEHRLRKAVNELATNEDILEFARWVNKNVTEKFTVETEASKKKDTME
jgi:hypothetical protein